MNERNVFFISDGTGLTASSYGNSLLTQFEGIQFKKITIPYANSADRVAQALAQVAKSYQQTGVKPIVFTTLTNSQLAHQLDEAPALVMHLFQDFICRLEQEFDMTASHSVGRAHGVADHAQYDHRIDAVNFTLNTDDGINTKYYDQADVILVGVSRCGKTPTSLYLSLQFGCYCANYPITADDMPLNELPTCLQHHREKLFGLTIDPLRLQGIRQSRRPDSQYSKLTQCEQEVKDLERLFKRYRIPYINTTTRSIEEIATFIRSKKTQGGEI